MFVSIEMFANKPLLNKTFTPILALQSTVTKLVCVSFDILEEGKVTQRLPLYPPLSNRSPRPITVPHLHKKDAILERKRQR